MVEFAVKDGLGCDMSHFTAAELQGKIMPDEPLNWLVPLPFLPADLPAGWLGAMVFVLALTLVAWAIVTITRAGSNVPTNLPTTTGRERTVPLHAQPHLPLTSTLRDAGIRQEPDHAHLFPGM
jgi:hypothetical protein